MTTYYTIAAGFRTGSSTLCGQLRELEVGYPLEGINRGPHDTMKEVNGFVGTKILRHSARRAKEHVNRTTKWIYIYREDTLAQAVSLAAARQTGHFSHTAEDNSHLLQFNFNLSILFVKSIKLPNSMANRR